MHNKKRLILTFAFLMPLSQALWAEQADVTAGESASDEAQPVTQDEPPTQAGAAMGEITETQAPTEPAPEQPQENPEATVTAETAEVVETAAATEAAESSEAVAGGSEESAEPADRPSSETPPEMTSEPSAAPGGMRDHWKTREAQYRALRKRAEEAGVMLPERPPWYSEMGQMVRPSLEERMAHRKEMMSMSAEERDAYRLERYEEMRTRADEMGMEIPDMPPWKARQQAMDAEWAKHRQVIQGMTDEERAACHAMHRRHMGMMPGARAGQGCGGMGRRGCGMYQDDYAAPMMPGYGSGYGPGYGYGPAPYGPGAQNFWDPNQ